MTTTKTLRAVIEYDESDASVRVFDVFADAEMLRGTFQIVMLQDGNDLVVAFSLLESGERVSV